MADNMIIRDPVHSFISFEKNGLVNKIIDTAEFQRLKYIGQLALFYFTYPDALHSRFSHSLGTYWLSKRLARTLEIPEEEEEKLSISALLHDIGHGPFSHTLEDKIMPGKRHEEISKDIIESEEHSISPILLEYDIEPKDISTIIRSGTNKPKYLHKLVSSQIDVDRFDYLLRDSLFTGNPHGRFDIERIIHTIRLNDEKDEIYIDEGGWYAVEHYLNCRYQMYKQVYTHHSTLAAEELLKKIIDRARHVHDRGGLSLDKTIDPILKEDINLSEYIDIVDFDVLSLIRDVRHCEDDILSDLSKRFFERKLFKPIRIYNTSFMKLYDSKEKIRSIIEGKGYDYDYYNSEVGLKEIKAYQPYTPDPKDTEEFIFINSDCKKDISLEIKSLGAIATPDEALLFIPEDCREEVKKVLS